MLEKIHFFYTNDLHSNFEHWPRVASFMKEETAKKAEQNESYWLVDIGDHIDRVSPIAEAYMGKANVALMNDLGYDIVTLGNNEGITLAHDDLYRLYDDADFQVVCSNLHNMDDDNPKWLRSVVQVQSKSGIKIGVLGLTTPFNAFYNLLNWHVEFPLKTLEKYVSELNKSADIIVLLSHLGINEDRQIADRFPEIDVIIGGHTHHLLKTGETVKNTLITAAGKHCEHVGEVTLTWDHKRNCLMSKEAHTTNITEFAKDLQTEKSLNELSEQADNIMNRSIIYTEDTIEVNWFKQTKIMEELTETLRKWTGAECAMLNAGLLLDSFEQGDVTYKDIHRICPHPINPCLVTLKGDELLEVIRASFSRELIELKLKGFGFRGEVIGKMIFSGVDIETDTHRDGQEFVRNVRIAGKPLDQERTYTLATADTFTFGRLLPEIAKSESKQYFLPEFIRDLLVKTLKESF